MYRFLLGVIFGVYIEQQYAMPDVLVQYKELEKFLISNYNIEQKENTPKDHNNDKNTK